MSTSARVLESNVVADPRWAQVRSRDTRADGSFFYSVKTTGVYCRPSCASRLARPENVAFHHTRAEAERAGFRPCKRCQPDQPPLAERQAQQVAAICRVIEESEQLPTLQQLAAHAGLSPFHLQRLFKRLIGQSPRDYALAQREERMRGQLAQSGSVTEAIYAAGYNSAGRFYAKSQGALGMTPRRYREGAPQLQIQVAVVRCSLGQLLVAATALGVCAVALGDDRDALMGELARRFPRAQLGAGDAKFARLVAQVSALIEAPGRAAPLPLDIQGTAFQQRVWQALRAIPAGQTVSYAELARRIGVPDAARAVAQACAANPAAVLVPCHRVVRSDGSLSGYRWGAARKRVLLEREGRA